MASTDEAKAHKATAIMQSRTIDIFRDKQSERNQMSALSETENPDQGGGVSPRENTKGIPPEVVATVQSRALKTMTETLKEDVRSETTLNGEKVFTWPFYKEGRSFRTANQRVFHYEVSRKLPFHLSDNRPHIVIMRSSRRERRNLNVLEVEFLFFVLVIRTSCTEAQNEKSYENSFVPTILWYQRDLLRLLPMLAKS